MKKPKTFLDSESDIFWIVFKEGAEDYYIEYAPGFIVEFDENSNPIGIEISNWSRLTEFDWSSQSRTDSYNEINFPEGKNMLYDCYNSPHK